MDAATAAFIASCKDKEGATKKLPTIFQYSGTGKDVYVCGKLKFAPRRSNDNWIIFHLSLNIELLVTKIVVCFVYGRFI